jgi:hypothetical protein
MRRNFKHSVGVIVMAAGLAAGGTVVQAVAAPFQDQGHDQNHDQDYSKNKRYQQGLREGKDDKTHNKDHSKKRHFAKDEDQKAYEAGYQKGHN